MTGASIFCSSVQPLSPLKPSETHMGPEEAERVLYPQTDLSKPVAQTDGAEAQIRSHPEPCSGPQASMGITSYKQTTSPSGSFQIAFEVDLGPKGNPQALHWEKLA